MRLKVGVHSMFLSGFVRFCSDAFLFESFHLLKHLYDATQYVLLFEYPILSAEYVPAAYPFVDTKKHKRFLWTKPVVYSTRYATQRYKDLQADENFHSEMRESQKRTKLYEKPSETYALHIHI